MLRAQPHALNPSMPNNNAARRMEWLLARVRSINDPTRAGELAVDVWPTVFEIGDAVSPDRDHEVARLLRLAMREVDAVQAQLQARGSSETTFAATLGRVRNSLSLRALNAQWQPSIYNALDDTVLGFMMLAADLLPEDEPALTSQQIAEARSIIGEFRASVESASVPPILMEFLRRQAALMEGAFRAYPIAGARAFREAAEQASVDWVRSAADIAEYEHTAPVQSAKTVWSRIQEIATTIDLIGKTAGVVLAGGRFALRVLALKGVIAPTTVADLELLLDSASPKLLSAGGAGSESTGHDTRNSTMVGV
jgi:hypothetical protein